ncbi:MAG: hypothetical protein N2Z75_09055 [Meiothermus sp.]|uniref:hypothetical protein n=1 Tax=Meiothermus sp. TaxID=1955249 RepID=UPI0025DAB9EB|nr:hypothetical protein [Meiothermus sp.]MCS7067154.1 hypothetical protein [Meiothermus sp.]MCX7602072.1 hypothetical protein [Meiothermus sp.]MDW8426748.1 hypothetical protein [Meiothermus sp.]
MEPRLDQVLVWQEQGRAVVQVEFFDHLGRLRREVFYRPTQNLKQALEAVARELAERGMRGQPRVRRKQGSRLMTAPELQRSFWEALNE